MKCASGSLLPFLLIALSWCLTACGNAELSVSAEMLPPQVAPTGPAMVKVQSEEVRITEDRIDWRWRIESPVPLKIKGRNTRRMQLIRSGGPADTGKGSRATRCSTHIEIHLTAECVGRRDGSMNIRSDVLLVGEDSAYAKGPIAHDLEESGISAHVSLTELPPSLAIPGEYVLCSIGDHKSMIIFQ